MQNVEGFGLHTRTMGASDIARIVSFAVAAGLLALTFGMWLGMGWRNQKGSEIQGLRSPKIKENKQRKRLSYQNEEISIILIGECFKEETQVINRTKRN